MSEETQTTNSFDINNGSGLDSPPQIPMDSPGSSVSSRLKEEYSQLLKYTIESTPGLSTVLPLLSDTTSKQTGQSALELNANNVAAKPSSHDVEEDTCKKSMLAISKSVTSMGDKLDDWMNTLRNNVLEELNTSLMSALRDMHENHIKDTERIQAQNGALQKEINQLTEQLNDLEHSFQQKCTLISNLTDSLVAQKKKVEMAKHFYHWKADHYDKQREIFTEKLAVQHHERKLNLRVLKAWYGVIQTRWRSRMERKCQSQAKEMCLNLTSDYETKVGMLNEKIAALEKKVSLLQAEREMYSEQVKKAFMRGMCALNMETMSVFGEDQLKETQVVDESMTDTIFDSITPAQNGYEDITIESKSYPAVRENVSSSNSHMTHASHTQSHLLQQQSTQPQSSYVPCCTSKPKATKAKTKSAKATAINNNKIASSSQTLAPPMASVVVEHHPPVNKQTMGKAKAVRYPKKNADTVPIQFTTNSETRKGVREVRFKPLAGQTDDKQDNRIANNSYIKVVD